MSNTFKSLPPYQYYNKLIVPRKQTYKDWFKTPIYHVTYDSENPKDTLTHGEYIKYFYKTLKGVIKNNEMRIIKEKEFKNEIATFIYRLSDENLEYAIDKKKDH